METSRESGRDSISLADYITIPSGGDSKVQNKERRAGEVSLLVDDRVGRPAGLSRQIDRKENEEEKYTKGTCPITGARPVCLVSSHRICRRVSIEDARLGKKGGREEILQVGRQLGGNWE